jgi:hypothetical protein
MDDDGAKTRSREEVRKLVELRKLKSKEDQLERMLIVSKTKAAATEKMGDGDSSVEKYLPIGLRNTGTAV